VSSFKLKDDEMRDCKNVRFVLAGSIQPREGLRNYDISGAHLTGANVAAKKMWRYIRSDNVVKLVVQFTDGNVYVDTNDGVFTSAGTVPYSSDSGTRFTQWRDSLFAVGTNGIPYLYNTDQAATFQASTSSGAMSAGVASPFVGAMLGTGAEGSWIDGNSYSYRFTLDYYMGNDFLGESFPLHGTTAVPSAPSYNGIIKFNDLYWKLDLGVSGNAADHYNISKATTSPAFAFPALAKTINIYRSVGALTSSVLDVSQKNARIIDTEFFYVGSIEKSDFDAAAISTVLFTDYGFSGGDRVSSGGLLDVPPKAKFSCLHKDRIWYGNIIDPGIKFGAMEAGQYKTVTLTNDVNQSRIYCSNLGEPISVRYQNWTDVLPNDGEGLTGLASWKDRALFAFKPNSITGLFGGDGEIAPGIPDTEKETVDENVGCIAPDTIAFGEGGILFLSNRGVMFFDGTKATPVYSKLIDPFLDAIPENRRSLASAVYDNKNRRYMLAISQE
jgi:hypothetical protein